MYVASLRVKKKKDIKIGSFENFLDELIRNLVTGWVVSGVEMA
jgi:hypothetical protein